MAPTPTLDADATDLVMAQEATDAVLAAVGIQAHIG